MTFTDKKFCKDYIQFSQDEHIKSIVSGQGFRALSHRAELQRKNLEDVKALKVEAKRINGKSKCEKPYLTPKSQLTGIYKNIKFHEDIIHSAFHRKDKTSTTFVLFNTKDGIQNEIYDMGILNHERIFKQSKNDAAASVLAHKKARTSKFFRIINNCLPSASSNDGSLDKPHDNRHPFSTYENCLSCKVI